MEVTPQVKEYLHGTANALHGVDRRIFMARTVRLLGPAGQRRAGVCIKEFLKKEAHHDRTDQEAVRGRL